MVLGQDKIHLLGCFAKPSLGQLPDTSWRHSVPPALLCIYFVWQYLHFRTIEKTIYVVFKNVHSIYIYERDILAVKGETLVS